MSYPDKDDENQVAGKSKPDDLSYLAIAIDFGKNVTENVTQGENKDGGRQYKGAETYYFYGDNIGGDEAGNKEGGND